MLNVVTLPSEGWYAPAVLLNVAPRRPQHKNVENLLVLFLLYYI